MQTTRTWDIFCKVIDNFGDIGVCWRLSCDLAERGQQVRLWVDDACALAWMAPGGAPGVQVRAWSADSPDIGVDTPGDVVIEAFGCEVSAAWIAHYSIAANDQTTRTTPGFGTQNAASPASPPALAPSQPVWINLEYLSAQPYAASSHGLPSPVMVGPARGMRKWFFYPGFTPGTGGLLRSAALDHRLCAPTPRPVQSAESGATPQKISLFCYEPPALGQLLEQLTQAQQPTHLQVTAGRARQAVQLAMNNQTGQESLSYGRKQLSISYLPPMSQDLYDDLLWHSDLNFVRGEDSLVRALWAGQPFIWQIYPQSDGAHAAKLDAFLDWLQAPPDLRLFHHVWNGLSQATLPALDLPAWQASVLAARRRLLAQSDLVTQLIEFVQNQLKSQVLRRSPALQTP
ncbi:MAG: elongation factor P maturation arginine rhamnosyltransferase EarP [Burkholderiaceae bacterium]